MQSGRTSETETAMVKSFDLRVTKNVHLLYNCAERQRQLKTHHKSRKARGEHDRSAGLVEMISAVDPRNEQAPHVSPQLLKLKIKSIVRPEATT